MAHLLLRRSQLTVLQQPTRLSVFALSERLLGAVVQVVHCLKASEKGMSGPR